METFHGPTEWNWHRRLSAFIELQGRTPKEFPLENVVLSTALVCGLFGARPQCRQAGRVAGGDGKLSSVAGGAALLGAGSLRD